MAEEDLVPGIIAFITDYAAVDRIIDHLKLTFVAERPPPPRVAYQEVLLAAETSAEYFSRSSSGPEGEVRLNFGLIMLSFVF